MRRGIDKKWKITLCVLGMTFCGMSATLRSGGAMASVVAALSEEQMVALSEVIVLGQVVSSEGEVLPNGQVATRHEIAVMRWLKAPVGVSGERFVFYTHGGHFGDVITRVAGEAALEVGDEVVVYLEPLRRGETVQYYPLGLFQGAYEVLEDAVGVKRVIRSDERIKRRMARSKARRASMRDEALGDDILLERYIEGVERLVREGLTEDEALKQLPLRRDKI